MFKTAVGGWERIEQPVQIYHTGLPGIPVLLIKEENDVPADPLNQPFVLWLTDMKQDGH